MDFAKARELMVEQQVRPWDVLDARVLKVLSLVPREHFVPQDQRRLAYADAELPLGGGRFSHKPVYDGRVLQSLLVTRDESVLEIGTGSAYLTACLAGLANDVVSLESNPALATSAREKLQAQHILNVEVLDGDAFNLSALNGRQFEVIVVNGAVTEVPQALHDALKPGGRMFYVRGEAPAMEAVVTHREGSGFRTTVQFETEVPYLAGAAPKPAFAF